MKNISLRSLPILVIASSLSAENILLNFGSSTYTGTNAPGHEDGGLTGTSWNAVWEDTATGILDENGNATDISIDFGVPLRSMAPTMCFHSSPMHPHILAF